MKKELTAKEMQSRGGKATVKKYGKKHMSELGKRSAELRYKKLSTVCTCND